MPGFKLAEIRINVNADRVDGFTDARCDVIADAIDGVDWGRLAREAVVGQLNGDDDLAGITFEEAPDVL